jgi:imidazoleglycerol-phosphate dehydratase
MPRLGQVARATSETDIRASLHLDGTGAHAIATGVGFLDHMLTALAKHALFDLDITATGDLHIDDHHTTEDCGIVLGQCLHAALGERRGIVRMGDAVVPMDEALVLAAVDVSGRGALFWDVAFARPKIGTFDTDLIEEFFRALAANAGITLHVRKLAGQNAHHLAEGCFKAVARALRIAVAIEPRVADAVPSTKGVL